MPQYNFTAAGGIPDGYGALMNSAAGSLVRLPDGTLVQAPQYMPPSSLQQIYGGMINAQGAPGQQAQAIRAVTVNPDGTIAAGGQANGPPSVPMPPPVPMMASNGTLSASGTMVAGKDQSRLGTSPQGMAFAYGQGIPNVPSPPSPPGLSAIAQALGLGAAGPALGGFLSGDPGQTDWSVANQGGQGINGPVSAPSSLPPNPPPTNIRVPVGVPPSAPRIPTPAFHAALMALQHLTTPASQAAVAAGQGGYVVKGGNSSPSKRGRNGNALGENAMMPTRAMDGSIRRTYAD